MKPSRRRSQRRSVTFTNLLLLAFVTTNLWSCADVPLQKLTKEAVTNPLIAGSNSKFCTSPPYGEDFLLKILFVIDKSGSNNTTDPGGARRFPPIINYLDSYDGDPNTYFGMIVFVNGTPAAVQDYTNDAEVFRQAVLAQQAAADAGNTPYNATIDEAEMFIESDVIEEINRPDGPRPSTYTTFWLSDGVPTDEPPQIPPQDPTVGNYPGIIGNLSALMLLESQYENVIQAMNFNTGYYFTGAPEQLAVDLMQRMAEEGNGVAETFDANTVIDFSEFAIPSISTQFSLKEIFVENINVRWNNSGVQKLDSDGDGLHDEFEALLGSNPFAYDSDLNQVSDKVEYAMFGSACQSPTCDPNGAETYPQCSNLADGNGIYPDTDGDFLNSCEEKLLGSDRDKFDSNSNFIPDRLEVNHNLTPKEDDEAPLDTDLDGLSNYSEIKLATPLTFFNPNIVGLTPYDYNLQVLSEDINSTCYSLDVKDISVIGQENEVIIHLIESTIDNVLKLRTARKTVGPNGTISILEEDFQ